MAKVDELGTIIVVILKAKNLNDKHSFYKQDVFAQASFNGKQQRTKVDVKGGQHPVWDEEFRFPVMKDASAKNRTLEVACFAKERRSDDLLGRGTVDITNTLRTGEFDEWVSLDIDGVVRGDIYVEMTYYANTPVPSNALSVPSNTYLTRRPSKLPATDRLYRPSQPLGPSTAVSSHKDARYQGQGNDSIASSPDSQLLLSASPSSSRSSSTASAKHFGSPLPPLPEDSFLSAPLPSVLVPGGGGVKPVLQPGSSPHVPMILRPGNKNPAYIPAARQETAFIHHASTSPVLPPRDAYPSSPAFGYSPNTKAPAVPNAPLTTNTSQVWDASHVRPAPMHFPVPTVAPTNEFTDRQTRTVQPPSLPITHNFPVDVGLPDPYLQVRYQTPLPLPPGSTTSPRGHQPMPREITPDPIRIEALRFAENEATRRKEQENRDLELALQLDRELNVTENTPTLAEKPTRLKSGNV